METPAENLQSSVAIPSSEIPLFSDLSEFVGSCLELSGVVGSCRKLSGVCRELSGVSFGKRMFYSDIILLLKVFSHKQTRHHDAKDGSFSAHIDP